MTDMERAQYYDNRERYFQKCKDFKEEVFQFFKQYKPRSHEKEKRTTD